MIYMAFAVNSDLTMNGIRSQLKTHLFGRHTLAGAFYPTALKGCLGIVFTHGVRMGGWWEKVCPGCMAETIRCRKLIPGRDIG